MATRRKRYSGEVRAEAVRLVVARGVLMAQAAGRLGVHVNLRRHWVREHGTDPQHTFPGGGKQRADDAEVTELRREVARLKMERDISRNGALLRQRADVRFGVMAKQRGI